MALAIRWSDVDHMAAAIVWSLPGDQSGHRAPVTGQRSLTGLDTGHSMTGPDTGHRVLPCEVTGDIMTGLFTGHRVLPKRKREKKKKKQRRNEKEKDRGEERIKDITIRRKKEKRHHAPVINQHSDRSFEDQSSHPSFYDRSGHHSASDRFGHRSAYDLSVYQLMTGPVTDNSGWPGHITGHATPSLREGKGCTGVTICFTGLQHPARR
ncbi:hypothetical protein DPMN_017671 [Dreissena polymorpha]|uniref:Uncharacterized protein n=1 Tax=Dreissena polymorpha TaxID=45954 RepID=A0A9D4NHB2_DREPO|nr:hypothetical protein DPMN_017671 [Dreissena polymorpha]